MLNAAAKLNRNIVRVIWAIFRIAKDSNRISDITLLKINIILIGLKVIVILIVTTIFKHLHIYILK